MEKGETKEEALKRECMEELGIGIETGGVFCEVDHIYPDISVHLTVFDAMIKEGKPQLLEHHAMAWITPGEIGNFEFCPADREILKKITEEF